MLKQFHRLEPLDSFLYHCSSLLPEEGFSSRVKTRARCQTSLRRLRRQSAQGRTNIAAGEIEEKLSEKDPAAVTLGRKGSCGSCADPLHRPGCAVPNTRSQNWVVTPKLHGWRA